jgi:hypothetical protein
MTGIGVASSAPIEMAAVASLMEVVVVYVERLALTLALISA